MSAAGVVDPTQGADLVAGLGSSEEVGLAEETSAAGSAGAARSAESAGPAGPAGAIGSVGAAGAAGSAGAEEILSVEGVGVRIGGRQVLADVSFRIGAGELTGLIGSNGAGKTTLFRVILGLQAASEGRVLVGGQPRTRRSRLVGYVPQKISLDPDMPLRARDLVGLGLDGHRFGLPLPSRRRRERVDEMLDAVDARRFAAARVGNLSGGEQQRVMIAHALVSRPRLLLLDEPLANLDIRSAQEVVSLLARITRRERVAVLISAHEMNPLLPVMDRVVYLAAGRAASGTTDEVVTSETLSALYGHHVDVLRVHGRILVVAGPGEVDEYTETAVHHGGDEDGCSPGLDLW